MPYKLKTKITCMDWCSRIGDRTTLQAPENQQHKPYTVASRIFCRSGFTQWCPICNCMYTYTMRDLSSMLTSKEKSQGLGIDKGAQSHGKYTLYVQLYYIHVPFATLLIVSQEKLCWLVAKRTVDVRTKHSRSRPLQQLSRLKVGKGRVLHTPP